MNAIHGYGYEQGPELNRARQSGSDLRTQRISAGKDGAGVALALGGGFARGFAHLGVLEVLEQEGIPISAIAGTSIGGLLGAAYADGISIQDLCDLGRRVRVRDFIRFHRSGQGTHKQDRIGEFLREWFQASRFEELCIPTAIVTTDIETCAPYVFTNGPLEVAIRASCAFPGLFRPVEHEGRMLADGCIVAPVPTGVAMQMNSLCVLGVAVSSNAKNMSSADDFARLCNNTDKSSPPEQELVGARQSQALLDPLWTNHADLLLEPAVHQISWDDFKSVDEARDAGAEVMRRALPLVREMLDRRAQSRHAGEMSGCLECELVS
jgi:NTE family protein